MTTPEPLTSPRPPRRRFVRLAFAAVGSLALLAGGSEAFLRWRYGLGEPPILMSDPQAYYRYAPSRHYMRLGNRLDYNAYSMRSDDFPPTKSSPAERRVLVIGDSVINGGGATDQAQLATSILQARLRRDVAPQAFVGNASAGGWGPQQEFGWLQEFGLLDADVVVIVVSSHDACEAMGAPPTVKADFPPEYRLALAEAYDKVLHRYVAGAVPLLNGDPVPIRNVPVEPCLTAFGAMLDRLLAAGVKPIVVFHYERPELDRTTEVAGHVALRAICAARGITPVPDADAMRASLAAGWDPYRDVIHPNAIGQRVLADLITPVVEAALATPAVTSAPAATTTSAATRAIAP